MAVRDIVNGNLRTILTLGGLLLTLGAGYGVAQTQISNNADAIEALAQDLKETKSNPMNSPVGTLLQEQIRSIDQRLSHIESNQEQILSLLKR